MKLAKFAAAVSLSAVADEASNTFAILPVAKTLTVMPLTVNFTDVDGSALPATKIVKTAGLAGSSLYVYDKENGKYTTYVLSDGNEWVLANDGKTYTINAQGQLVEGTGTQAEANPVARGAAVFLETPSSFTGNFYVAGTPGAGATINITEGANLIGAPTAAEFNLNAENVTWTTIANSTITNGRLAAAGDIIEVPTADGGASTRYYYNGTAWGKIVASGSGFTMTSSFVTDGCTIPAGKGFWYVRKAGAGAMTIAW